MSLTTLTIKDASGVNRTIRTWDESEVGDGPYQFVKMLVDSTGDAIDPATVASVEAAATSINAHSDTLAITEPLGMGLDVTSVRHGLLYLAVKRAAINGSASGNNTIVAAVTDKKLRVLSYMLNSDGDVNAKFQSGAGGIDLTGLHYMPAAGNGVVMPYNPTGWFETAASALLNLNLSASVAVGGVVTYVEVD